MRYLLIAVGTLFLLSGCKNGDKTCDPACGEGMICNTSTGQCIASTEACKASVANSCDGLDRFCNSGDCKSCEGRFNCDGMDDCECEGGCNGTRCKEGPCDPDVLQDCGDSEIFCNTSNDCQACPSNAYNCDGVGNDCECSGGCNGTRCKTSIDGSIGESYTTDACPAISKAVTSDRNVEGQTSVKGVGDHCMLTDPYFQAIKLELTEKQKIRARVTTNGDFAISFRSICAVDNGCSVGNPYARDLEPGTYNLIVATADPASFSVLIEFLPPDGE